MRRLALCAISGLLFAHTPPADPISAYITAKDWSGLEAWARAQIEANPKEARYHLALGTSLASQGHFTEAIATFRKARELAPDKVEASFNLCLAGAQVSDRETSAEGLDGVALQNVEAARRLLGNLQVKRVLGADEPAAHEDFSRIRIRYQPPAPPYPREAKIRRVQGIVVVEITQDRDGRVIKVHAVEGPEELHRASEAYAACWRFFPIPADRKDERLCFRLIMPFRLR